MRFWTEKQGKIKNLKKFLQKVFPRKTKVCMIGKSAFFADKEIREMEGRNTLELIRKWNKISLVKRILMGLIVGAVLGMAVPGVSVISILGDLFVGAYMEAAQAAFYREVSGTELAGMEVPYEEIV